MSTVIKQSLAMFLLVYVCSNFFFSRILMDFLMLMLLSFLVLDRLSFMVDTRGLLNNLHGFVMDMNWLFVRLHGLMMNFEGGLVLLRFGGADFFVDGLGSYFRLRDNWLCNCFLGGWLLSNLLNLRLDFGNGFRNSFYLHLNWLNSSRLHDLNHSWLFLLDLYLGRYFFFLLNLGLFLGAAH